VIKNALDVSGAESEVVVVQNWLSELKAST
jgi:hypothetical protein